MRNTHVNLSHLKVTKLKLGIKNSKVSYEHVTREKGGIEV